MTDIPWFFQRGETLFVKIFVQPGAKKTAIDKIYGQELRITVNAPQERGAANTALIAFLSALLNVSQSSITICKGRTSRHKTVAITNAPITKICERLAFCVKKKIGSK